MDDSKDEEDYEVGYKHPPKHTQFQPGTSGNPAGRPPGSKNLHTIVRDIGKKLVKVNGPGGQREISMTEAVVMQMAKSAAQGDHRAQKQYFSLIASSEQLEEAVDSGVVPQSDKAVMASMLRRMRGMDQTPMADPLSGSGEGADE